MKRRKIFLSFILIGTMLTADLLEAITALSLHEYALPGNTIREKLTSLFQTQSSVSACTHDKTWIDFGSWHWLIGQLTTEDNTPFVIKGAKYPPYASITTPQYPGIMQIHDAQQNISRIARSIEAQKIIADKQLNNMRIPPFWAYPISGNNRDLSNHNITDQQVMIIEEMVTKKSEDTVWCSCVGDKVQADVLHINQDTFHQLVTFAQSGKFLDLTPKNLLVDAQGKLVVIDLEDTLAYQRKELAKSHGLLKPLKRFKLQCKEEGAALYGVGITGLSNEYSATIRRHGQQLINKAKCTLLIKRNIVEIVALTLAAFGIIFLMIHHMCTARKLNACIRKCRIHMTQLMHMQQKIGQESPAVYQAIAQRAVRDIVPDEHRDSIFDAFATIAFAENMHHKQVIRILGRDYDSPYQAIRKSIKRITTIWKVDRSPCNKDMHVMADKKSVGVSMLW